MSEKSDIARIESILDYIDDISTIIKRHQTIENALSDIEGQYALMMCIQQIGEIVNKIQTKKYLEVIPVKEIVSFRNIIVHNYNGINLDIVESIIKNSLPELQIIIEKLLKANADFF